MLGPQKFKFRRAISVFPHHNLHNFSVPTPQPTQFQYSHTTAYTIPVFPHHNLHNFSVPTPQPIQFPVYVLQKY